MQIDFQEYFEDFFKDEEEKLRILLELKLRVVENSDNYQYLL